MTDRKNVIKGLTDAKEFIRTSPAPGARKCRLMDACEDAIFLIKEQPEIIRCKYCDRRGTYDCPIYVGGDGDHGSPDDWFCAAGEPKEKTGRREQND